MQEIKDGSVLSGDTMFSVVYFGCGAAKRSNLE